MEAPLALYRRYRPETFTEVIGQEHVTGPLRAALRNNRVHHAYLFSGPRGCGKTTSARILARALNCEQGPIDEPCGTCRSCQDLARGGPGSVDVIEIDAASHGGVDDARDLRERAFFAPVASRYKVYIIDEAHMVTTQGFNALLKLVEEPPPHLKFIFATTEPEKVIGTIRSRTHHYPFRLIPPRTLSAYLAELCAREEVAIEPAALPLVVRAGGGSARDSLSVLDQLMGGAGDAGVTYSLATSLLGYTPDTLLDEVVDAFAAADGRTVFGVVDKVIETGQDPRRFTEDLLRRLRDLVIVSAVPDAPVSGLIDVPEDQAERLVAQAERFGRADLVRAAELVADGLTELRGATAPRLLLELICARVLLPGADDSTHGVLARLDRLEKRMSIAPAPPTQEPAAPGHASRPAPAEPRPTPTASPASGRSSPAAVESAPPPAHPGPEPAEPGRAPGQPVATPPRAPVASETGAGEPPRPAADPRPPEPGGTGAPTAAAAGGLGLVDLRRLWPEVLEAVKPRRKMTWILLSNHAQVVGVDERTLTVGFNQPGAHKQFIGGSGHGEILRQVLIDLVGQDYRVEAIVDQAAQPGGEPPRVVRPAVSPQAAEAAPGQQPPGPVQRTASDPPALETIATARQAIRPSRAPGARAEEGRSSFPDDEASRDDPDAEDLGLSGADLLQQRLGASIIEEITHD